MPSPEADGIPNATDPDDDSSANIFLENFALGGDATRAVGFSVISSMNAPLHDGQEKSSGLGNTCFSH